MIILDPGHGGDDRGNRGPTGYIEADGVLDIGLRLRDGLIQEGYDVRMTREKDETVTLYDRTKMANSWQGSLLLSLHTNAGPEGADGIEIFYTLNNEWQNQQHHQEAKRAAEVIQRSLVEATGLRDRGVKTRLVDNTSSPIYGRDYYAVIRRSNMPALIIEMGFHSNPREEALLKTPEFRQKLADAIVKGMKEAYPMGDLPASEKVQAEKRKIALTVHNNTVEVNGLFYENRNYVPIKFFEEFGYEVTWDEVNSIVKIRYKK
ncbi:N-acetylmuramoyl-L-alanine amidase [Clostridium formicaceticum]|uniref:Sporulation-specific N-acetylmuramoyl-L-alanine amidase n=1 Tax=Clostridium formicaceticum TaxID=1497 RepID=A0AAC9RGZ3_9CLOT|nr:N-acetylmuramoyl-L-alanine amidase [Clostridium formicaceticum]AOY76358.1 hypothetical protein BJL90_10840 [Clostridium formicaceticum]ARE86749.1 Sporulation-specific N-acetylmuramoyl-L-alanine amidase [Clostridium formicaceticum]